MMVGTISIGIPQPRAPNISKIESTKLSDVFEQTSSVCLNGSIDLEKKCENVKKKEEKEEEEEGKIIGKSSQVKDGAPSLPQRENNNSHSDHIH